MCVTRSKSIEDDDGIYDIPPDDDDYAIARNRVSDGDIYDDAFSEPQQNYKKDEDGIDSDDDYEDTSTPHKYINQPPLINTIPAMPKSRYGYINMNR